MSPRINNWNRTPETVMDISTQKKELKMMSNTDPTKKLGGELMCSRKVHLISLYKKRGSRVHFCVNVDTPLK